MTLHNLKFAFKAMRHLHSTSNYRELCDVTRLGWLWFLVSTYRKRGEPLELNFEHKSGKIFQRSQGVQDETKNKSLRTCALLYFQTNFLQFRSVANHTSVNRIFVKNVLEIFLCNWFWNINKTKLFLASQWERTKCFIMSSDWLRILVSFFW